MGVYEKIRDRTPSRLSAFLASVRIALAAFFIPVRRSHTIGDATSSSRSTIDAKDYDKIPNRDLFRPSRCELGKKKEKRKERIGVRRGSSGRGERVNRSLVSRLAMPFSKKRSSRANCLASLPCVSSSRSSPLFRFTFNCGLEFNQRLKFILINISLIRNDSRTFSLISVSLTRAHTDTHARVRAYTHVQAYEIAITHARVLPFARPFAPCCYALTNRLEMSSLHFSLFLLGIDNLRQIVIITCSPFAPHIMACGTLHFHGSQRAAQVGVIRDSRCFRVFPFSSLTSPPFGRRIREFILTVRDARAAGCDR